MSRQVEQDDFRFAALGTLAGLADGRGDRMARFRSGNNALGLREQAACVEALELRDIDRFHQLVLEQLRYDHACSVIPQSARMDVGGSEVVPQREHRQQRRIAGFVSEVVAEDSARELRAGVGSAAM